CASGALRAALARLRPAAASAPGEPSAQPRRGEEAAQATSPASATEPGPQAALAALAAVARGDASMGLEAQILRSGERDPSEESLGDGRAELAAAQGALKAAFGDGGLEAALAAAACDDVPTRQEAEAVAFRDCFKAALGDGRFQTVLAAADAAEELEEVAAPARGGAPAGPEAEAEAEAAALRRIFPGAFRAALEGGRFEAALAAAAAAEEQEEAKTRPEQPGVPEPLWEQPPAAMPAGSATLFERLVQAELPPGTPRARLRRRLTA
ncbi:unnamed protein product, partial [Prorocentrum cordatum]